jgi:hypothetical protein
MSGVDRMFAQARAIVAGQRAALECAVAAGAPVVPTDVLDDVETQFLWGVYAELAARESRAPGGFDRIKALLVNHLAATRGLTFEAARAEAIELEDLFNQAEPLFEAIVERGRLAVTDGNSRHFAEIAKALSEAQREAADETPR